MPDNLSFDDDAIRRLGEEVAQQVASDMQAAFDEVYRTCSGKPVQEVKAALEVALADVPGSMSDADLSNVAEHIARGQQVTAGPPQVS